MSQGGGSLQSQIQAALAGQYPAAQQNQGMGQMTPDMQQSLQGNQAMVQSLSQGGGAPQMQWPSAPQGQAAAMPQSQGSYMDLMRSLMMNPQAFTGGAAGTSPFAQALAANPQGASLANWQPTAPAAQVAPNPIAALQAAQAQQTTAAAAQPAPPPIDNSVSGSGSE